MLYALHRFIDRGLPIYGMNCGTVGFMMNQYGEDDLPERVARAQQVTLHPLRMHADTVAGLTADALAINERSEEHTSELQSLMRISYAVFCLKKKKKKRSNHDQELKLKQKK